jgi:GPI mannosyltransferase 3
VALELQAVSPLARVTGVRRPGASPLGGLIVIAIFVRLIPVLFSPSLNWADEIFQSLEQAHRVVYGTGLVPWEFELGVRSWLLPGLVAGLMEITRLIGDGPDYYLPVIFFCFAAVATLPVICVYRWCERSFGVSGAIIGGLFVALAPELVYFGARTLAEVVAGHLLIAAIYLLDRPERASPLRFGAAGALIALIFVLRLQLAPALAVIALWTTWRQPRERLWPFVAGAACCLALSGLLDAVTLGYPFASLWRYLDYNLFYGVSSLFGTQPWDYYLQYELALWQGALIPITALVIIGAIRRPLLLAAAAIIVASHSAIPHKEIRFIYPAAVLLAALAAIGLAQVAAWGRARYSDRGGATACVVLCASYGCFLAYLGWTGDTMAGLRTFKHGNLLAASVVEHMQGNCGIGLYGLDGNDWTSSGGYSYLQQPVPIYWPKDAREFAATENGFDVLISTKPWPGEAAGNFTNEQCFGAVCIARRRGSCAAVPMLKMPIPAPLQQFAAAEPTR